MPLTRSQCQAFNDYLGRRPYPWDKKISEDRKPMDFMYVGMYATEKWPLGMEDNELFEKIYVTRPNDPGLWDAVVNDACIGTPCQTKRQMISHGVDQLRYTHYKTQYTTQPFCLDQLKSIEEGVRKLAAMVKGYQELPEYICGDFIRLLVLRKAGSAAVGGGLWLPGVVDSQGNPAQIDITDDMFAVSKGEALVKSKNSLLINLNAHGGLSALSITTTALLAAAMGQLTMEYLANIQEDLNAAGYHKKEWLQAGKFSITVDPTTRRQLLTANPALTQMYSAADFQKGGAFYSFGITDGCGDWLFKEDKEQMRFRFRADLDGKNFAGGALAGAIWIERVWPYENVAATFGLKPQYSYAYKNAPLRFYHAYNRDARTVFVGDIGSVNSEMKFGLARSFMGDWKWLSPDFFTYTDPNTGLVCQVNNDLHNQGYWVGEYDLGIKTEYWDIEKCILGLGQAQPTLRKPNTGTVSTGPTSNTDYQALLAYASMCGDAYLNPNFAYPAED